MGNSIWCSVSGERLASAARDGDLAEAKYLLEHDNRIAAYSSFAALNSPLHLAASKGHTEMVMLLLEKGADANSRNFCGQTALMQACRKGKWEVVQTLMIFDAIVTKSEYLSRKTGLHFAAAGGHIRCIRLLLADFVPSATNGPEILNMNSKKGSVSSLDYKNNRFALSRFVNKAADSGLTALHLAALNGHSDCLQLLLDLQANVSAMTYHYGSSTSKMIGSGSTALHFAASGGNIKCCQLLIAKGSCRLTMNCNGWLPVDVAKHWGHRYLVPLLSPHSDLKIQAFLPSNYLTLPLMSILNIARECKLQSLTSSSDDNDLCAVCLENACSVAASGCMHELCVKCALYLCSTSNNTSEANPPGSVPCPLCRNGIVSFISIGRLPTNEVKQDKFESLYAVAVTC